MEKWLRYTVLPVGQGAGAFVQIWAGPTRFSEAGARPVEAALIDLGSLGWKRTAGAASALFVANQLAKMTPPALDAVFLSHSDSDHTNLLKNLLEYFDPPGGPGPKPVLTVGQVWFGGFEGDYVKRGTDPLALLRRYGATLGNIGPGETSWQTQPPKPLRQTANLTYALLVGNSQNPGFDVEEEEENDPRRWAEASQSFLRNVVSLVLVVGYGTRQVRLVATGDGTGLTLAMCNRVMEARGFTLAPVLTLSLPHHGSETSTYDLTGRHWTGTPDAAAVEVVARFVANLGPESITASAAERGTYRHPAARVITAFAGPVGSGMYREPNLGDEHFFTAHYPPEGLPLRNLRRDADAMKVDAWPGDEGWYTGHTNRNVFTIDYTRSDPRGVDLAAISYPTRADPAAGSKAVLGGRRLPAGAALPPRAAGWGYYVSSDGTEGRLERLVDVGSVDAQARAALEAVHGPLPADERFVFIPSAPEPDPAAEQAPPRPVVVAAAPRRRAHADRLRRPRQLP